MTYTIELDATEERVLEAAAAARGVALDAFLREVLKNAAQTAEAARREAVRTTRGKYAHVGLTPELRRQMKDEEIKREEAKFEARFGASHVEATSLEASPSEAAS